MTQTPIRGARAPHRLLLALAALVVALTLAACGGDDEDGAATASANGTDLAFVQEMTPHHESAVEMAEIAKERSTREEITDLADDVVRSQSTEITQMRRLAAAFGDAGVAAGDLGVSAHDAGMSMDASSLRTAEPFDRAFIDMMIPHHQGAIRMARAVLAKGADDEVAGLARAIVDAQAKEIEQMNAWRQDWYGAPSPAGGVPAEDDTGAAPADEDHGDGGH